MSSPDKRRLRPPRTANVTRADAARSILRDLDRQAEPHELARIRGMLGIWSGARGVRLRPHQRAVGMFMPGLRTRPWFDPRRFDFAARMEALFPEIEPELRALEQGDFGEYGGAGLAGWREFVLCHNDKKNPAACARCPRTASLIRAVRQHHGYVNQLTFLTLEPGTTLRDHVDPHNYLVSVHLPILAPERSGLRVAAESRAYEPGRCLAFDNSFLHRAWNHGTTRRVILTVHTLHPDLSALEVQILSALHPLLAFSEIPT